MISLGMVTGTENSSLEIRCRRLLVAFERQRKLIDDVFTLNIVFHSPLSPKRPCHEGMIAGAFSRVKRKLVVAIAVPRSVPTMSDDQIEQFIVEQLHESVDFAFRDLATRGIAFNPLVYHAFIDHVVASEPRKNDNEEA